MKTISFIKEEYIKANPILYRDRYYMEQGLISRDFDSIVDIVRNDNINETSKLSFTIPFTPTRKISIDDCEKLVKFENEFYIIKEINIEDSTTRSIKVSCEHESTSLKGIYCFCMNIIGKSPEAMFNTIMSSTMHPINTGYKWGGTDVKEGVFRHLQTDAEASVYANLVDMAKVFNGFVSIYTDESGQRYVKLITQFINNGKFIKKNLDMKTLAITADSKSIFSRLVAYGASDKDTGHPLTIMEVNPTKQSYVENYSFWLSKGVPTNVIDTEAQYQQTKILTDDKYIDAKDLYTLALEELAKCSIPTISATLQMTDLSVYIDNPIESPKVGMLLRVIDKEIDFIFDCRIIGVERPYNNPMDTRIEISNLIRYDTQMQNINHTVSNADKVISTNPNGGDGTPFIPENKVFDGDHVNVTMKFKNTNSKITQQGDKIALTVEELDVAKAEIKVQAKEISSTVEELGVAKSQITQQAKEIASKVDEGEFGSLVTQHAKEVKVAWNKNNKFAQIDDTEGFILGDPDNNTYSKVSYDGKISLMLKGSKKPYHCLSYTGVYRGVKCLNEDYKHVSIPIPNMFNGIDDRDLSVSVSIAKLNDSNQGQETLCYWSGVYGVAEDGSIQCECMSTWRDYEYDSNENDRWVSKIHSPRAGYIDIAYTIIA